MTLDYKDFLEFMNAMMMTREKKNIFSKACTTYCSRELAVGEAEKMFACPFGKKRLYHHISAKSYYLTSCFILN